MKIAPLLYVKRSFLYFEKGVFFTKKKNQFLALMSAAILTVSLSACGSPELFKVNAEDLIDEDIVVTSQMDDTIQTEALTEAETEAPIEYKTIDPPEDGWTLELLNEVTYIGGQKATFPLTLSQFPSEFSIGRTTYLEELKMMKGELLVNGEDYCFFTIEDVESEDAPLDDMPISQLMIGGSPDEAYRFPNTIVINGLTFGDSIDNVTAKLGDAFTLRDPDSKYKSYIHYYDGIDSYINISDRVGFGLITSFIINYRREEL
ncbi:MAG: hypothetical protein LBM87_03715 [Ruminococcus sp.]|nr:hypothetical protein [Ruminococcus sp.]